MKRLLSLLLFCNITISFLLAQPVHQVKGTVIDKSSRQPLEFINVMIVGLNKGGVTNAEGKFSIGQVPPGIYRLQASAIGYKTVTTPEYILSTRDLHIQIEMEENQTELEGVTVTASPFRRDIESPVSLRIIGLQEIEKSPGANRDISRIVQSYPGVAFSPIGYRNDLIVRGGSPSENRFYLDGVEIPNINHFSTDRQRKCAQFRARLQIARRGHGTQFPESYSRSFRSLPCLQRTFGQKDFLSGFRPSVLPAILV